MADEKYFRQIWFLLLMTALIAAFSLSAVYAPSVLVFLIVFINTVLLTFFIVKSGFVRAMAAPVVSLLVVYAVSGNILLALSVVVSFLLTAVVLSLCMFRRLSISKTVILTSLCYMVFIFLSLYEASARLSLSIPNYLYQEVQTSVELWVQGFAAALTAAQGEAASELVQQLQANVAPMTNALFEMIPSVLIVSCAVMGYFMVVTTKAVLRRAGVDLSFWKRFHELHLDLPFAILMVLTIFASLFFEDGVISVVLSNLLVLFTMLLGFCGLTILDYFLLRRGVVRAVRVVILVVVLLLASFITFFGYLLILLGLLDASMNFRKRLGKGDGLDG